MASYSQDKQKFSRNDIYNYTSCSATINILGNYIRMAAGNIQGKSTKQAYDI